MKSSHLIPWCHEHEEGGPCWPVHSRAGSFLPKSVHDSPKYQQGRTSAPSIYKAQGIYTNDISPKKMLSFVSSREKP